MHSGPRIETLPVVMTYGKSSRIVPFQTFIQRMANPGQTSSDTVPRAGSMRFAGSSPAGEPNAMVRIGRRHGALWCA